MCRFILSYKFCVLTELNSTLSSTSDMHMLLNSNVNNESESESDEETDDNLVIMRDVPLASHINKISQNSTVNVTKIIDDSNELPNPFIGFPIFSKVIFMHFLLCTILLIDPIYFLTPNFFFL